MRISALWDPTRRSDYKLFEILSTCAADSRAFMVMDKCMNIGTINFMPPFKPTCANYKLQFA